LLLVNYRPEYRHDWGNKTYYTQLRLDPLAQEDAQKLLTALLGDDSTLQPLTQFILEKTDGTPFFMEEIVQALREQGLLTRPGAVGARGRAPLPTDLHIPPTVQAVLASRIDRLPAEEKTLLQTLSVIGKEFSLSLLKQVVDKPEEELQRLLSHLQTAEFIYEQPAFPDVEYTFKHALTQEVASNSLLLERRKVLHEQTARAIEALYHTRLENHYSELAHHYSRSGNTRKAVEYLGQAGRQTVQNSAYIEAIDHLTRALELLDTLPTSVERLKQELLLQTALGRALSATRGQAAQEVGKTYARARELCQQLGETSQLLGVLQGLRQFYMGRAELQPARELAEQLLHLAQEAQDLPFLVEAHRGLGASLHWRGEFTLAREHLERGLALYDPQQQSTVAFVHGGVSKVGSLSIVAWVLWCLGYPDQALQRSREAPSLGQELSQPHILAFALNGATMVHQFRREGRAAQEQAETLITLASEHGFTQQLNQATALRGWALTEQGKGEEGITQIRQGLAALQVAGHELLRLYALALLAGSYGKVGQPEEGLIQIAEALEAIHKTEGYFYEAELYRLKGQLTLQRFQVAGSKFQVASPRPLTPNPQAEAEECFLKAVEIARRQQAKSWELRAVMSLSRLWQQQGKTEEARQMLAEIYGWFTEGFDTADLKDAKALLEELEGQAKRTPSAKRKSAEKRPGRKKTKK
jgi:tetratricopeptide (TPR) repeat protein